ncbi:hypothetical protein [Microbacterium sp.]|uniref:hypothetical protein n=1 Tax=Microbacterium sp. TaxID=51671 RepID=UPI0039E3C75B
MGSLVGAVALTLISVAAASPAHAEVSDANVVLTAQCADDGFTVIADGAVTFDIGDTVTSALRVDGVVGEAKTFTGEADDVVATVSATTSVFADSDTHVVEWLLNDVVHASGEFAAATSCPDAPGGDDPTSTLPPVDETVAFSDPVCTDDGRLTGTATVQVGTAEPDGVTIEATIVGADIDETLPVELDSDRRAIVEFPIASTGPTTVTVVERDGDATKTLGAKTYDEVSDCATQTPTPEPTAEPTSTPEDPEKTTPPAGAEGSEVVPEPVQSASPTEKPAAPIVRVSSTSVPAGGNVTVRAQGFAPGEALEIWLHSDPWKLTDAVADAQGAISVNVGIAGGTDLGDHKIEVRGATSGSAFIGIVVTDDLAITGIESAFASGVATTGVILVLGGVSIFLLGRRALAAARA